MKTTLARPLLARCFTLSAVFVAGLAAAPFARATNYVWDPNGNRSDAAGSGAWNTAASNAVWDNGTADVVWPNTSNPSDAAIFGGVDGSYSVTVANGVLAPTTYFNASGYTLVGASAASPGTLGTNTSNSLLVANGKTLTIGANMSVTSFTAVNNTAGSTGGTINITSGGLLYQSAFFAALGGVYNVSAGGTFGNTTASYVMSNAVVTVNGAGAQFLTRGISLTNSTVTLTQGRFEASGSTSTSLSNSTLNLNGGTFVVGNAAGSTANSTVNFNGATVQNTTYGGFISGSNQAGRFVVQAGGAKFDTNYNMTLSPVLQHDTAGPAVDGGLLKGGSAFGALTLSAANTYNGGTTVSGGTLVAGTNGALGTGDASVIATSVSLSISTGVTNPFNNVLGRLTLEGGGTFGTDDNGYLDLTSGANIVVGSLTLGGVTYTSGVFSHANAAEYIAGTGTVTVVPEPGSLALASLLAGTSGVAVRGMRRKQRAA